MDKTIEYYDKHAEEYCRSTLHADMTYPLQRFTFYLQKGNKILDLGCGSGRDTVWLRNNGYEADAMDGSLKMAEAASAVTGIDVKTGTFASLDAVDIYDGIFASASLLHVPYEQLEEILIKVFRALKKEGILYGSFHYGNESGWQGERYYTDMNEERLLQIMAPHLKEWTVLELWHSHDSLNRDELWFNMILRRIR